MQSGFFGIRAFGVASAFLALTVTMTVERPSMESLGLGMAGILVFAVSLLFKGSKPVPSRPAAKAPENPPTEAAPTEFPSYGLLATDSGAGTHPALMAGVRAPRR